jgi:hypothetical protein
MRTDGHVPDARAVPASACRIGRRAVPTADGLWEQGQRIDMVRPDHSEVPPVQSRHLSQLQPLGNGQDRGISGSQRETAVRHDKIGHPCVVHRGASAVDLIIAATAAHHGLMVLHDDADYRTVAKHAPDLTEHNIRDIP